MNREELIRSLIQYVAAGKLDASLVQPVLRNLSGDEVAPAPSGELLETLLAFSDPASGALAAHLRESRRQDALALQGIRSRGNAAPESLRQSLRDLPADVPLGWGRPASASTRVQAALRLLGDRLFLRPHREKAPVVAAEIDRQYQASLVDAFQNAGAWGAATLKDLLEEAGSQTATLADFGRILDALKGAAGKRRHEAVDVAEHALSHPEEPLPPGLDEDLYLEKARTWFVQVPTLEERRRLLDLLCSWPSDRVAPVLVDLELEPWAQERAAMILTLRFGHAIHTRWDSWRRWLRGQIGLKTVAGEGSRLIVRQRPLAMLYLWYSRQADADPDIVAVLERLVANRLDPVTMDRFVDRWAKSIPSEEWRALTGEALPVAELAPVEPPKPEVPIAAPRPVEPRPAAPPKPPPPPPKPSIWEVHLKPFFLENWYMVAGVMMVLVGSSLLAYYTWDKAPVVRYTVMPALLGGFTFLLAWMGGWIERRDAQFKATAAVLRSAAIGLLPVNFMAVALLANDAEVSHRGLYVPAMGVVYLSLFGWGLRRWCSAVHDRLGLMLGGTLLFLNSLVVLAPLARVVSHGELDIRPVVGTGFYLGFFALAAAVVRFSKSVLSAELARDRRVVWFFGATLAVTFVQVFAWVHGYLKHLPHVYTYAPMVVLTGGLVLYMERRILEFRQEAERHGAESFLGFAFILLGVLMGLNDPWLRIATFVLAGGTWIAGTVSRKHPLHAWIGLTLAVIGGASVGLIPGFPPPWMPSLGIALALVLGLFGLLARQSGVLSRAAGGLQAAVLMGTAVLTLLIQLRRGTNPSIAAGHLTAVAALFGVLAWREQKIRWAQTAMVVLALALPYVAGFDLKHQILHSTTLVGGLALLSLIWTGATLAVKSPVLTGARSTVLWIYGVLAIACMAVRATIDDAASNDPLFLEIGGPLLMCVALVWAGWFSRSLIPSGMAMLLGLILAPEMKEHLQKEFPNLAWGSGFGSACSALGFMVLAFRLRAMPSLQSLGEGDRYMGITPYPLRRLDPSLFTWPLLASAFFLAVKVETWNFFHCIDQPTLLKAGMALVVSGLAWMLLAVYHRPLKFIVAAVYVGLFWFILGFGVIASQAVTSPHPATVLLAPALAVQALFFLFRFGAETRTVWAGDLLTAPARRMLRLLSLFTSAGLVVAYLFGEKPEGPTALLTTFTGAQLLWHGLASRHLKYGFVLYLVDWMALVAWSGGASPTWMIAHRTVVATMALCIAVQAFQGALEFRKPFYDLLRPILVPFQCWSSALACGSGCVLAASALNRPEYTTVDFGLCLVALLLSARALSSGPIALLAAVVGYLALHADPLLLADSRYQSLTVLSTPWHVALFALVLAAAGHLGGMIHQRQPRVVSGAFTPKSMQTWPALPWLVLPAVALVVAVSLVQIALPHEWATRPQVWAPYLGAATVALVVWSTGLHPGFHAVGAFLSLGNVLLVREFLGSLLRPSGLSEIHLVALGIALTLLQCSLFARIVRVESIVRLINRSSLGWAGLVLVLISANYLVHPNLAAVTALRFVISGAMALLAGVYFRRAARRPAPGEEPFAIGCEGLYHFGVTISFWCAALTIPALRGPITALFALGLPVLYFYARAEAGRHRSDLFVRYRASAATLGFVVLALYALRGFVQMSVFPNVPFDTHYYHANSPVIIVLGLVLLRLHALGGTSWLAFYGGLAVMGGSYFGVSALPGLSPFQHPVASAWTAVALAHFFTIASIQHSPLRTWIQQLAGIDANQWHGLRRPWGVCMLVAVHGMVLWGCQQYELQPRLVAPLIVGAASVLVHQGILRQSHLYPILAQVEVLVAVHMGFLVPSYLPQVHVVWALLGLWAAVLAAQPGITRVVPGWKADAHLLALALLTAVQIGWHGPASTVGLWAFATGAVLAALTPTATREPRGIGELLAAALLPWAPAWLVWFSQARSVAAAAAPWPALITTATVFATAAVAQFLHKGGAAIPASPLRPRLWEHSLSWLTVRGGRIHAAALGLGFVVTILVQGLHWGIPFAPREVLVIELLYAAFAASAFIEGRLGRSMAPYFLMELCVLAAYLVGRQQLLLTRVVWRNEYDVWASLLAFFAFVGAKQLMDDQPLKVRIPLRSTLLALPVFSVSWVFFHHLGTELGLVVIGLHSAAFSYMGKDDRESPYHLIAVGGFVAFVTLLFAGTLHLAVAYAYVIPVGIGVLVLLQLFKERVAPDARNIVRSVVLVGMIGSAGWSALLDEKVPLMHNLAVLLLCLGAMALGGLLHIRLYAALGFCALMLDLVVIFVKSVMYMERTLRMTIVGSSVLALGATLVFGAIYYKTHRSEIEARLSRWRLRFSGWE